MIKMIKNSSPVSQCHPVDGSVMPPLTTLLYSPLRLLCNEHAWRSKLATLCNADSFLRLFLLSQSCFLSKEVQKCDSGVRL